MDESVGNLQHPASRSWTASIGDRGLQVLEQILGIDCYSKYWINMFNTYRCPYTAQGHWAPANPQSNTTTPCSPKRSAELLHSDPGRSLQARRLALRPAAAATTASVDAQQSDAQQPVHSLASVGTQAHQPEDSGHRGVQQQREPASANSAAGRPGRWQTLTSLDAASVRGKSTAACAACDASTRCATSAQT